MSRKLKPKQKPVAAKRQPPRWQREKNISLLIWIFIPITIALALGLVGYWSYDNYVAVWRQPVAKINKTDVNMDYFVKMLRFSSIVSENSADTSSFPYEVLRQIEDNEMIRQKTTALDIEVPPEKVDETIQSSLSAGQGNSTETERDERYQRWLDNIGLTDSEYREIVEADLLRQELGEYFKEQEVPTEAKHVHLYTIKRDSEEEASEALSLINSGNATLINELSEGDLGWVPKGIYPEFDEIAFGLEAGNVTGPIPTSQGYSLIQVTEISDESKTIEDQHRDILATRAFESWFQEERTNSVTEYIDQAKITWALNQIK